MVLHVNEAETLFQDVLYNLDEIEACFEVLSEQAITVNQEGFEEAKAAAFELKEVIETHKIQYFDSGQKQEDFDAFKKAVEASVEENGKIIMANHDMAHDAYRGIQVAFKSLVANLQTFFTDVAEGMGYEKGPDMSSWVKPEETTRSLYDQSIKHLVNFFGPKTSGDRDAGPQHGKDQDKKQDNQ